MKERKGGVAYYLSHPIQYFSPLLAKLAGRIDLKVYYFSDASVRGAMDKGFGQEIKWDTPLLEGYKYQFLKNYSHSKSMDNRFFDAINPGIIKTIRRDKAAVIIVNGWSYFSSILVIVAGKLSGKKVWLRAENPLNQEVQKSRKIVWIKKILLGKILFRLFIDKCLYIGTESKNFFRFYGVPEHKLLYTPYAVDNEYFNSAFLTYKNELPKLKAQLGLPADKKIILFSGKYIAKKRPLDLLEAVRLLDPSSCLLIMVGDGELRPAMESFIKANNMNNVILTGFVNQGAIPRYYAVADVFVMCSGAGETWGLSVNEAMNFASPVVVSATCGSSTDLVKPGINGWIFPEGDVKGLADCLWKIIKDEPTRKQMGEASLSIVRPFSIDAIAGNIEKELCN